VTENRSKSIQESYHNTFTLLYKLWLTNKLVREQGPDAVCSADIPNLCMRRM